MSKAKVSPIKAAISKVGRGASSAWNTVTRPVGDFVRGVTSTPEFESAVTGCAAGAATTVAFSTGVALAGGPFASGGSIAGSCLLGAYAGYFDAAFGEGTGSGFRAIDDGMTGYELYRYFRR